MIRADTCSKYHVSLNIGDDLYVMWYNLSAIVFYLQGGCYSLPTRQPIMSFPESELIIPLQLADAPFGRVVLTAENLLIFPGTPRSGSWDKYINL